DRPQFQFDILRGRDSNGQVKIGDRVGNEAVFLDREGVIGPRWNVDNAVAAISRSLAEVAGIGFRVDYRDTGAGHDRARGVSYNPRDRRHVLRFRDGRNSANGRKNQHYEDSTPHTSPLSE